MIYLINEEKSSLLYYYICKLLIKLNKRLRNQFNFDTPLGFSIWSTFRLVASGLRWDFINLTMTRMHACPLASQLNWSSIKWMLYIHIYIYYSPSIIRRFIWWDFASCNSLPNCFATNRFCKIFALTQREIK